MQTNELECFAPASEDTTRRAGKERRKSETREPEVEIDLNDVDVGFVINIATLRTVLNTLNVGGRRFWIASDPADAIESGFIMIGVGSRHCTDRLNTISFRIPVLNPEMPFAGTDRVVVVVHHSVITAEVPGFYVEKGRVLRDDLADFESFYFPLKRALLDFLSKE